MTARGFTHVMTRSRVLVPIAVGAGLLLIGAEIAGFIVLGVGFFKALRMLGHKDLDLRLELKGQKEKRGIRRLLRNREREQVLAINRYIDRLLETKADPKLASEIREEMWQLVADAGAGDAAERLRRFRESLPPLNQPWAAKAGLAGKVQEELDLIRVSQKEVESVG